MIERSKVIHEKFDWYQNSEVCLLETLISRLLFPTLNQFVFNIALEQ